MRRPKRNGPRDAMRPPRRNDLQDAMHRTRGRCRFADKDPSQTTTRPCFRLPETKPTPARWRARFPWPWRRPRGPKMTTAEEAGRASSGGRGPGDQQMRLNRYLALCGVASRRAAMQLVSSGRVRCNGRMVADPGTPVRVGRDRVEVDGEWVRPPRRWAYFAYHKPRGVIVTHRDEQGRQALDAVLRRLRPRLFAVGRLDRASEGLLLLTNHGALAQALLHPRHGVEKVYRVRVTPRPSAAQLARLSAGVTHRGERLQPSGVRLKRSSRTAAVLTIVMQEGKKREIRRMCRSVGLQVRRLRRLSFAGIHLGDLPPGAVRPLTTEERAHLAALTGLAL
ncbi:MAG: pseudouridine synthase [Candidatus Eisenbacteria bacterium]|nr:pseudouridine synthase [Candidatus Eisenbacteria bacterium]